MTLDDAQLNRVYSPILSPLAWDLGHIANFEELWLVQTVGHASRCTVSSATSMTRSRIRVGSGASCRTCATPSCAPTWPRCASAAWRCLGQVELGPDATPIRC